MESAYADPGLLRDLGARGGRFARDIGIEVVAGAETAGVPLAASISLSADLPFAFVRKPGYRGHEIHEPQVRGADVAAQRVLLVDDAISSGTSVERFAASLGEAGAELAGVFVLVDMRDVADAVSPLAAALPTDAVSTYLEVLDLATAGGLLDPALHELAVDAIVNRWSDDDPRWDLLPVTGDGPSSVPLRQACPFIGPERPTASGRPHAPRDIRDRITKAADTALSDTHLGYRLAAAGAVSNPQLLLEYQRQVLAHGTETADPGQSAARDGNETRQRAGVENARREPTDSADA